MTKNSQSIIWSAFVADALALGPHWVYDTEKIQKKLGKITKFHNPISIYHPTKHAGDFTHYGDQLLVLLKSIKSRGSLDPKGFMQDWKAFMFDYTGYKDHATTQTLENMEQSSDVLETGSDSDDFSVVSRVAAILNMEGDLQTAKLATQLTHNNSDAIAATEYMFTVLNKIVEGSDIKDAVLNTDTTLINSIQLAVASTSHDTTQAIQKMGPACDTKSGLAGTLHCVLKYDNMKDALLANVMAGGDSAARGMAIAMIFAAAGQNPPKAWVDALAKKHEIEGLL